MNKFMRSLAKNRLHYFLVVHFIQILTPKWLCVGMKPTLYYKYICIYLCELVYSWP